MSYGLNYGRLYIDESVFEIKDYELKTLEISSDPIVADEIPALLSSDKEVTIECKPICSQDIASLIMGKRISNNYFKQHGGIMRRKKGKK